jgi:hypothetical protein
MKKFDCGVEWPVSPSWSFCHVLELAQGGRKQGIQPKHFKMDNSVDTPNGKDAISDANLRDEALAKLLDMGYEFEVCSIAMASLPDELVDEGLVQRVVEILQTAQEPVAPPKPTRVTPIHTSQAKSILKSHATTESGGFFAQARNWFTQKILPTNVTTLGNTIVNRASITDSSPRMQYRNTLDRRPRLTKAESWEETSTLERSRKVRFSSENINIEPETPTSETGDSDVEQPVSEPDGQPTPPSQPEPPHMHLGSLGPHDSIGLNLEAGQALEYYMSKCELRREEPIPKMMDELKETEHRIDLSGESIDKKTALPLSDLLACQFGLTHLSLENCHMDDDVRIS